MTFDDVLTVLAMTDRDLDVDVVGADHALVWDASYVFTKKCKEDFKALFDSEVTIKRNVMRFIDADERLVARFCAIMAGYVSEETYDSYVELI